MITDLGKWILLMMGLLVVAIVVLVGVFLFSGSTPSQPTIKISAPATSGQIHEGQTLVINSVATDNNGIVRIELLVDDGIAQVDNVPAPQKSYSLQQTWKAVAGQHMIGVRAFNTQGVGSEKAIILVNVTTALIATPTPLATPLPAPTSIPPTAAPSSCANQAAFVADVTIPQGSTLPANQSFNKVWRVHNTSSCMWNNNYQFVYVGGESMATVQVISMPYTMPNSMTDLTIAMIAPTITGLHVGQWQLRDDRGTFFGPVFEVRINIPGPTPGPTAVPSFNVTGLTASVNPSNFAGACPGLFNLIGSVTTNRAGTLTYQWIVPGIAPSNIMSFNAPNAGTFTLPTYSTSIGNKGSLWAQVQTLSPNPIASAQVPFNNNCSDPKPAPPQAAVLEPGNGFNGLVNSPIHVVYQGSGNTELSSVSLYANGVQVAKQSSRSATRQIQAVYDWVPSAPGSYELVAVAIDIQGQQTSSPHVTGFVRQPTPPTSTPVPPAPPTRTPVPPPPPTSVPARRDINGTWSAGEWIVELNEAMGCPSTQCGIAGTLTHAVLPAPEINSVRGTANLTTGAISFTVEIPGGRSFSGTVSADSHTMSGTLSGVGSITFTK